MYIYSNHRGARYEIIFNLQSSIFNLLGVAGVAGATQFLLNWVDVMCFFTRAEPQRTLSATQRIIF